MALGAVSEKGSLNHVFRAPTIDESCMLDHRPVATLADQHVAFGVDLALNIPPRSR